MVVRLSSVRRQHFQMTFSLKLLGQFELNFVCILQAKGGKREYIIFGLDQMSNMAAMPIYGTNLTKSSTELLARLS